MHAGAAHFGERANALSEKKEACGEMLQTKEVSQARLLRVVQQTGGPSRLAPWEPAWVLHSLRALQEDRRAYSSVDHLTGISRSVRGVLSTGKF